MANKNISWDRIVEVKNGSLRVVKGWTKPVIFWKSESEYLTRFIWFVLNDTPERHVSKIYHTDRNTWEIAVVSDYTSKLDRTIDLLVGSLGLKEPEDLCYPWVYVINPTNNMLRNYFSRKIDLRKYIQIEFVLTEESGLEADCFYKNAAYIDQCLMVPYKEYMASAEAAGHYFQSIVGSIDTLKDEVDPELWDYMMF